MKAKLARKPSEELKTTSEAPKKVKFAQPEEKLSEQANSDAELSESYDSDDEYIQNRRGAVPAKWYEDEKIVGYNVKGKQIPLKPSESDNKLDTFITKSENPDWWRTIRDELNQKDIVLTDKQLEVISRIKSGKAYSKRMENTDYSYSLTDAEKKRFIHPFDASDPKKSRFMPSKFERIKINKLVHSIQMGWLKLDKDIESSEEEAMYDIWSNAELNALSKKLPPSLVMPKMNLPKNDESYNPPPEYLWTPEEIKNWKSMHVDDRLQNYFPVAHKS